jgi:hypothetical protein
VGQLKPCILVFKAKELISTKKAPRGINQEGLLIFLLKLKARSPDNKELIRDY